LNNEKLGANQSELPGSAAMESFSASTSLEETPEKNLYFIAESIRNEISLMHDYIKDKEQKKLLIFRYSFAILPILGVLFVAAFTYINDLHKTSEVYTAIFAYNGISLIVSTIVLLLCLSVIKYLASIKADTILAERNLNCFRSGYYETMGLILKSSGSPRLFDKLIGQHNKYPLDNASLKDSYREKVKNNILVRLNCWVNKPITGNRLYWIKRGLKDGRYRTIFIRSADMFSILTISIAAVCVSFLPLLGNLYLILNMSFTWVGTVLFIVISSLNILVLIIFINRIILTLIGTTDSIEDALGEKHEAPINS